MKRRAQAGVTPPVAKKPKLAKDEVIAEAESERPSAVPSRDRPSKSRIQAASGPIMVLDEHSSSSSSTLSHNGADVLAARTNHESVPQPSSRPPSTHAPSNKSITSNNTQEPAAGASRPFPVTLEMTFAALGVPQLPTTISTSVNLAATAPYTLCWARVNRCPWWPGKVCNVVLQLSIAPFEERAILRVVICLVGSNSSISTKLLVWHEVLRQILAYPLYKTQYSDDGTRDTAQVPKAALPPSMGFW